MHEALLTTILLATSWPALWPELNACKSEVFPTLQVPAASKVIPQQQEQFVPKQTVEVKPEGYAAPADGYEARPWPLSPTGHGWFKAGNEENYGVFLLTADWCSACPGMKATLAAAPEVGHVELVDYDRQREVAIRLLDGQQAILPQLVSYSRRDGKTVVRRLKGTQTAEAIKAFLGIGK